MARTATANPANVASSDTPTLATMYVLARAQLPDSISRAVS